MRKGGTAALLQKVNAQLRGERVSTKPPDEKDEVEAYLSGLNVKASKQLDWDKFGEVSDISISDDDAKKAEEVITTNKFMKKKPTVQQQKENVSVPSKPAAQPSKTFSKAGVSAALDKAKAFHNKYSSKTAVKNPPISSVLSDSDMDMDISLDEDVLASISKDRPLPTTSLGSTAYGKNEDYIGKTSKVLQKQTALEAMESDEDSLKIGKGGNKFLKKKSPSIEPKMTEVKAAETGKPSNQGGNKKFQLASAQKYSTQVKLDTDEESLADFIQGLSSSSAVTVSPPKTPREQVTRKPKIKTVKSKDTESEIHSQISTDESIQSAAQITDVQEVQTISEESAPVKVKKKPEKRKTDAVEKSVFKSFGLQTLDDLDLEEDTDLSDDIPSRSPSPLKSILSTTPRPITPKYSRSRVRYSIDEVTEIRSRSPSPDPVSTARQVESVIYTDEFEETTQTVKSAVSSQSESSPSSDGTESDLRTVSSKSKTSRDRDKDEQYSDDFDDSRSGSDSSSSHSSYNSDKDSTYYSDSYTSTDSEESHTSTARSIPKRKTKTKTRDTQTLPEPGLWYHWNLERGGAAILSQQYGLANVDPTPIATYVVNADALEALTAYSPSVLAMNDMLRQQLEMTRNFIASQRRLHQFYVGSLSPECAYTTLEDTRQYLNKHRKPRLTFDEALKQVKEEMDLS